MIQSDKWLSTHRALILRIFFGGGQKKERKRRKGSGNEGELGGCPIWSLVEVFKWLGALSILSALSKHPILKRKTGEKISWPVSHTAGQGFTSSPLVCAPVRRAFTRDGRNTKRADIDFLLGGGGREGRLLGGGGVDCPHQAPLLFSHPSPFLLLSPFHLPGSGGTLCLSARQWSVSC